MNKVPAWRFKSTKADRELLQHPSQLQLTVVEFAAIRDDEQMEMETGDKPAVGIDVNHLETRK